MPYRIARPSTPIALAAALVAGCSVGDGAATPTSSGGAEPPPLAPTAGSDAREGGAATSEVTTTSFRVAHVAPALGLVDFCYRAPHGDAYVGPVLTVGPAPGTISGSAARAVHAPALTAGDAGLAAPALTFGAVTGYVQATGSGTFTLAVVAADSHACSSPLLEAKVTLDAGKRATIALVRAPGSDAGDATLTALAYVDDDAPDPAAARVRLIHAALGDATHDPTGALAATWAATGSAPLVPLAAEILPAHASSPRAASPAIDALGYGSIAPLPSGSIRVAGLADAAPSAWASAATDLGLTAGAVHTGFVATGSPLVVVWCDDATADLAFTRCATLGR